MWPSRKNVSSPLTFSRGFVWMFLICQQWLMVSWINVGIWKPVWLLTYIHTWILHPKEYFFGGKLAELPVDLQRMNNIIGSGRVSGKCPSFSPKTFQFLMCPLHKPNLHWGYRTCVSNSLNSLYRHGNLVPMEDVSWIQVKNDPVLNHSKCKDMWSVKRAKLKIQYVLQKLLHFHNSRFA